MDNSRDFTKNLKQELQKALVHFKSIGYKEIRLAAIIRATFISLGLDEENFEQDLEEQKFLAELTKNTDPEVIASAQNAMLQLLLIERSEAVVKSDDYLQTSDKAHYEELKYIKQDISKEYLPPSDDIDAVAVLMYLLTEHTNAIEEAIAFVYSVYRKEYQTLGENIEVELEDYLVDLTAKVTKESPTIVGRQEEIQSVLLTATKKTKRSSVLVGPAGTGKTAIAEGLALILNTTNAPKALKGYKVYELITDRMNSGTAYVGSLEKKVQKFKDWLNKNPKSVIFIDEIHMLHKNQHLQIVMNALKPMLARGELIVLGATTPKEYRESFNQDSAFKRRFNKVDVSVPSTDETKEIITMASKSYSKHHSIELSKDWSEEIVAMSDKVTTPNRNNPDLAIDVLDTFYALIAKGSPESSETLVEAAKVATKLEPKSILVSDVQKACETIYGQDLQSVIDTMAISTLYKKKDKPIASFMLPGPTGTGKTQLAKSLAKYTGCHFIRIDMTEYTSEIAVTKLIGSTPGYVGSNEGLFHEVSEHSRVVLLFDEYEKGHSSAQNLLMQILDNGKIATAHTAIDFTNCIVMCTTNAGTQVTKTAGFGSKNTSHSDLGFLPELINRFDSVVRFKELSNETMKRIAKAKIKELAKYLITMYLMMMLH